MTEFLAALAGAIIGSILTAHYTHHSNLVDAMRPLVAQLHQDITAFTDVYNKLFTHRYKFEYLDELQQEMLRTLFNLKLLLGESRTKKLDESIQAMTKDFHSLFSWDPETYKLLPVDKEQHLLTWVYHSGKPIKELLSLYERVAKAGPFKLDE